MLRTFTFCIEHFLMSILFFFSNTPIFVIRGGEGKCYVLRTREQQTGQ